MHSDDPEQPKFTLTMKGQLLIDLVAEPSNIVMRDLKVGARGTTTFELKRSEDSTAKIESVDILDTDNFKLRRIEGEADGDSTYEVTFLGRKEVGTVSTKIRVVTTGESTPLLVIPVRASAALNLRYLKSIRFSRKEGEIRDRVIRISSRFGDAAPKIKRVEDPDGLLEYEILPAEGSMASISAKIIKDKWEALDEKGRVGPHPLIVFTNDRDEPRLELEYRVAPGPSVEVRARSTPTPTPQ